MAMNVKPELSVMTDDRPNVIAACGAGAEKFYTMTW
jgi:hypothetical protein